MEKKLSIPLTLLITILLLVILSCTISTMPPQQVYPTQSYLTPASMEAVVGEPVPVISISDNWQTYNDTELGIFVQYPPNWTATKLVDTLGVGFYPPGSEPDLPTPAIKFRVLNQSYTNGQPLFDTGCTVTPVSVGGIMGQEYHDTKFSIPDQAIYIELPLGDGILLIEATMGPTVDLTPQLIEMLKTFHPPLSFIYPVDGQVLGYEGSYMFKITPIAGADGYLWGFFQNGVGVWENLQDEGTLSGTEYNIMVGSLTHSKFIPGDVKVMVRASINGEWTDATSITIKLEP